MNKRNELSRSIWITWERQTRNRSASEYLGIPLWEIIYGQNSAFFRYTKSICATLKLIFRHKPRYVFVQNPSVVLSLLGVLCSKLFRFKLIVDAHNSGIYYEGRFNGLVNPLNRLIIRNSKFVIVTNEEIAKVVSAKGGRPLILPDPLPCIPVSEASDANNYSRTKQENLLTAFCITSWGEDEPVESLIAAAADFSGSVDFYFTGNYLKANFNIISETLPRNVHLLGFVDEGVYFSLLKCCDFTIDLTTRPDCLVCGAYESVAAGKPIILSDTKPQRAYFDKGAVFCRTNRAGIRAGVGDMLRDFDQYKVDIELLKAEILERERLRRDGFISSIVE
jgi:glycosyltransferase involved in cell wall biosynthesis